MRHIFIVLALLSLTACKEDKAADLPLPREVTDASVAQFCGMALREHAGPKAQIFVRGVADPYWFSTVRDAFAFAMLPEMPKSISAIYVNDMARAKDWDQPEPGMWVEAHQASYVIGSRRLGGMGADETIPFGDEAAAHRFAQANGGRVVRFADVPSDYILPATQGRP
ncbi:nitrous oxide reductase accessory protein NosL [Methylocella tundrae]|nr:nitrous oxide reductase accessory protein NosL [Methylocella tundrae]